MSAGRIIAAVAAAAIAAGAVWRRRGLSTERLVLALLLAVALGVYASGLLSKLPNAEEVIVDLSEALGKWTYLLVGAMAFLETGAFVGLVAPGETTVLLGGVVAGQGEIDILLLIGLVWSCAILGDTTSFFLGRRLGRDFMLRHGRRLKITPERLTQVEGYFSRHGGKTILVGRFIGLVRALAPFVAGSARMPYGTFLPYSVIGTGLWAATFALLGFVFWHSFDQVANIAGRATLAFGALVGLIAAGVWLRRRLRTPEDRRRATAWLDRQSRRPLLRPLAAVARPLVRHLVLPAARASRPPLRFVRDRITPGNLGIELTTTAALAAGGLYLFALYSVSVSDDARPKPGDSAARDIAVDLRSGPVVDVVEIATELGAFALVGGLVLIAAAALALRRRIEEPITLMVGTALLLAAVNWAKPAIDRPRPEGGLVDTDGASFPSGHATYATVWIALGVVASRVLPGVASRAVLVTACIGVTAVVGLSRVYLGVHWWSDVVAGWALGIGVFAACAAVAVVVAHIRHN